MCQTLIQRVVLLTVWEKFEQEHGTGDDVAKVQGMMPIRSKKRHLDEETGEWVEGKQFVSPTSVRMCLTILPVIRL
jgi:hypothetical protein